MNKLKTSFSNFQIFKFSHFAFAILTASLVSCGSGESKTEGSDSTSTSSTDSSTMKVASADNQLTDAEKNEGWQLLFDGQSKGSWHIYNGKSDGAAWKVGEGTLYFDPVEKKGDTVVGGGDLVSGDEYDNFHFKTDWKVDTGANSGIIFYIKEDKKFKRTYHTGPEMQVLDNAKHPDAKIIKHRAGDLYDLITSAPETVKPANEWNTAEIIANKGSLEFYLNGTKVVTTTMWDDNWKKMLSQSKFKDMKEFGTFKQGRIGLQDHGNKVWYKNIKIKRL